MHTYTLTHTYTFTHIHRFALSQSTPRLFFLSLFLRLRVHTYREYTHTDTFHTLSALRIFQGRDQRGKGRAARPPPRLPALLLSICSRTTRTWTDDDEVTMVDLEPRSIYYSSRRQKSNAGSCELGVFRSHCFLLLLLRLIFNKHPEIKKKNWQLCGGTRA